METIFIGKNCIEVEKTDSTNSYLASLMAPSGSPKGGEKDKQPKGVFEGTIVIAKHQERGRGQRSATWESEPGKNLTLSILLQPTFLKPEEQFQLNKAVSLGVAEFVTSMASPKSSPKERTFTRSSLSFTTEPTAKVGSVARGGGEAFIKWPNDIYIGTKKVAGILIENSVSGTKLQQSIVGIGINVNQEFFLNALPNPTSLKLATGKDFDLKVCLSSLCSHIEKRYLQLRHPTSFLPSSEEVKQSGIDADYLKCLYRFDEWASYKYKGEIIQAKVTGISKVGKLMLEAENARVIECDFKEVGFC